MVRRATVTLVEPHAAEQIERETDRVKAGEKKQEMKENKIMEKTYVFIKNALGSKKRGEKKETGIEEARPQQLPNVKSWSKKTQR